MSNGRFEQGLEIIKQNWDPNNIDLLILKGELLAKTFDDDNLKQLLQDIKEFPVDVKDGTTHLRVLLLEAEKIMWLGPQSQYEEIIKDLEKTYAHITFKDKKLERYLRGRINLLYALAWFWAIRLEGSEQKLREAIQIFEKLGDRVNLAQSYNLISDILGYGSQEGYEFLEKSTNLWKEIDSPKWYSMTLCRLGHANQGVGNYSQALQINLKAYDLAKQLNFQVVQGSSCYCLGRINLFSGNYQEAEKYFLEYRDRENLYPYEISVAAVNLGELYLRSGKYEQAFATVQHIIQRGDLQEVFSPAYVLVHLVAILAALKIGESDLAKKYLKKMESRGFGEAYTKLCTALVLKHEPRLSDQFEALKILQDISDRPDLMVIDRILAKRTLCELLLMELKLSENQNALLEIRNLLEQITEIAQTQFAFPYIVETMILSSKLRIVEGDVEEARNILDDAKVLVKEKELSALEQVVDNEINLLNRDFGKLMSMVESNPSIREKIQQSQIESYFDQALRIGSIDRSIKA